MGNSIKYIIKFIHVETASWYLKEASVLNKAVFYGKEEVLYPMENLRFLESMNESPVMKRGELCFIALEERSEILRLKIYTDKQGWEGMKKPFRELEISTMNELLQQFYPVSTEGYTVNNYGQIVKAD